MKNNFFKKLAFVLALALVVTSIAPVAATTASAAKAPALTIKTKTLYVGGKTHNINVKNKPSAKSTYAWTSSNKKVATVNAKNGVVKAVAPGKATIKCVIKNAKTAKTTKTLTAVVTIKQKATAVAINNPTETVGVGEKVYDFNRTLTAKTSTDKTYWVITEDTAGTTVASNGVVSTTKVGEFTIQAVTATSRAQFDAGVFTAESAKLVVKVPVALISATQATTKKLDVTFNTDMKDAKVADFSIVKDDTKQVIAAKAIAIDGKKVTVETFADINDGKVYTVTYKESTTQFTATDNKVASLAISPAVVEVEKATEVKVSKVDANGVVLGEYKYGSQPSDVTFTIETTQGYTTGEKLVLFRVGDTAKAKAVFHTYKYDTNGNEIDAISSEVVITAVDKTAITVKEQKYTVAKNVPDWKKDTLNTKLAIGDTGYILYLNIIKTDSDVALNSGYTLESSNKDILLVNDNLNLTANVIAVAQGTAYVLVKDDKNNVVWSLPVSIVAKRDATSLEIGTDAVSLSKAVTDVKDVTVVVKDQYTDKMDPIASTAIAVDCLSTSNDIAKEIVKNNASSKYFAISEGKVTFKGFDVEVGVYVYKVTVGKLSRIVTVTVKAPTGDAAIYQLVLSSNKVDVNFDGTSVADKDITIKVATLKGGVVAAYNPIDSSKVIIKKGNDVVDSSLVEVSGTAITFKASYVSGGAVVMKADAGSYSVSVENNGVVLNGGFVIEDTQAGLTAVRKETSVTAASIEAGVKLAFEFYYEGAKIATPVVTKVEHVKSGNTYFIKTITVNVAVAVGDYVVPMTITVNQSITVN